MKSCQAINLNIKPINVKKLALILFNLFFVFYSYSNNDNYPTGARSAGMGNSSVTLFDVWSTHHNQAGLARIEKPTIGFHHENKFIVKEYALQSLAFVLPTKSGNFGLSLSYFGYSKYNESKIGLGYGKKLGDKISIGVQIDYFNTYISENYGSKGTALGEVGILAEPMENFFVGVHVFNPTMSQVADYDNERIPTIFKIGLGYKFADNLFISGETEKDIDFSPVFKVGVEYMMMDDFYLRAGISTNPIQNSFGIGYVLNKLKVDVAFSLHQVLGVTPHFTVVYEFK